MMRSSGRTSYANVTSTLALVVALGGTSAYAASKITSEDIGRGQVKSANLSPGAVTSAKVRDGSLRAADFGKQQLPAGPAGDEGAKGAAGERGAAGDRGTAGEKGPAGAAGQQGPKGDLGDRGPAGPAGVAFPDVLPSGRTLRGSYSFGGFYSGASPPLPNEGSPADSQISFPVPLPTAPTVVLIRRKQPMYEEGDPTAQCPGSVLNPQAAPGYLCVYESKISDNSTNLTAFSPYDAALNTATRFGVGLYITQPVATTSTHRTSKGSWAVTAP